MSKIFFIILLFISIQNSLSQNVANTTKIAEDVYNYLYQFYVGMAEGSNLLEDKSQCTLCIKKNKNIIIENLKGIVNNMNDSSKLFKAFMTNGLNILTIHGFAKNCKIFNLILIYNSLTIKEKIKELGEHIFKNTDKINDIFGYDLTLNNLFNRLGKALHTILKIKVK